MACRTALRCVFMTEPWISSRALCCSRPSSSRTVVGFSNGRNGFCDIGRRRSSSIKARNFHSAARPTHLNCSYNNDNSGNTSSFEEEEEEQGPPQEAVLKAISEVSKAEGRVGQTTNVVIGGTVTDDATNEWVALDQKVNSYPTVRGFTAIGTGGDDFVQAMIVAVESVIQQPIPEGQVKQKVSSRGKYVSVNIGPVQVDSSEQVQAVYNAMRRDDRMKYFL